MLEFTNRGLYCPAADIYIDPWRPVARALITHAHSDHARRGHGTYLATRSAAPAIRHRLGDIDMETVAYGEVRRIGDVAISFHPAGHIPGSAQIRLERNGEVWVVSGDYKLESDGVSEAFEPVRCHSFVSECTFGMPVFNWRPQAEVMGEINGWWRQCREAGRVAVIGAYSLGKAQRIIAHLDTTIGPIVTHGAVEAMNDVLRGQGIAIPATRPAAGLRKADMAGAIVVAPPAALSSPWLGRFGDVSTAFASGWMAVRGIRRRRGVDRGFVMSDHADWQQLRDAIRATGAERIFVTHGFTSVFQRYLEEAGFDAHIVATEYEGETAGEAPSDTPSHTPSGTAAGDAADATARDSDERET